MMTDSRPYLISVATRVASDSLYYGTLKNLEESVEFKPVVLRDYPGNLQRFWNLPEHLDLNRMVIFTDTSDVIFQCPIPKLENKIYVTPEFNSWDKNEWWVENFSRRYPAIFRELGDSIIVNCGAFAMPVYKLMELADFLKVNAYRVDEGSWADQPLYNLWLKNQKKESVVYESKLMVCLFDSWNRGIVRNTNGVFVNEKGEMIPIVHANDTRVVLSKSKFVLS